jgi:hypothetical protein
MSILDTLFEKTPPKATIITEPMDPTLVELRKKLIYEKILEREKKILGRIKETPIPVNDENDMKKLLYAALPAIALPYLLRKYKILKYLGIPAGALAGLTAYDMTNKKEELVPSEYKL